VRIEIAEHAGYCYGVERALKLTRKASERSKKPIHTLGPIIHNPQVVDSLAADGVRSIDRIEEATGGTVIVRSHGVEPEVIERAAERSLEVVDATCPFVAAAQQRAADLVRDGYKLVLVGEHDHPEVVGILARARGGALVAEKAEDVAGLKPCKRVGVVVQTTQSIARLQEIVDRLLERCSELKVFNTICDATTNRQQSAKELAKRVDVMLVVGGKNSANTTRLAQICRETNSRTHHIETATELRPEWFKKAGHVGVTAGASTPDWILDEVVGRLHALEPGGARRTERGRSAATKRPGG